MLDEGYVICRPSTYKRLVQKRTRTGRRLLLDGTSSHLAIQGTSDDEHRSKKLDRR